MADLAAPASLEVVETRRPLLYVTASVAIPLFAPVAYQTDGSVAPAFASGEPSDARVLGFALTPTAVGHQAQIFQDGKLWLPSTPLTLRATYVLSHNSGKVCPIADLSSHNADQLTYLGFAESTSVLNTLIKVTGVRNGVGGGVQSLVDDVSNATVTTRSAHGLTTGASVTLDKTGTGYDIATHGPYTVTVVDSVTFTLGMTLNAGVNITRTGVWYV